MTDYAPAPRLRQGGAFSTAALAAFEQPGGFCKPFDEPNELPHRYPFALRWRYLLRLAVSHKDHWNCAFRDLQLCPQNIKIARAVGQPCLLIFHCFQTQST